VARSERQLKDEVSGRVDSILILFYALLAMSVLMALLGIANALTLSILGHRPGAVERGGHPLGSVGRGPAPPALFAGVQGGLQVSPGA
jgi:hypothetical protein